MLGLTIPPTLLFFLSLLLILLLLYHVLLFRRWDGQEALLLLPSWMSRIMSYDNMMYEQFTSLLPALRY
jgi:hypothetical protein